MARRRGNAVRMKIRAFLVAMLFAVPTYAHISLEQGGTHLSRYGDGELKAAPCGRAGGTRGTHIYTYEPGATITVSLVEFVSHPSYFRIAFDDDGDDGFKEPASILPIDPNRKCPDGPGDHCGASDFYNTPAVLPNMDNLNPHLGTIGAGPKYTWQVKLPDVECTNCTLQVIQVMEDDTFHGPYDPTPGVGVEDLYHQCIDLVLKRGVGDGGLEDSGASSSGSSSSSGGSSSSSGASSSGASSSGASSSGASSSGGSSSGNGAAPGGGSSGCAATGRGESGALTLASVALALGLLRRRRR
jgi:uncharacterized protein (TIGR03382 family)